MQSTVRIFETKDNTYYIGYGRTANTTYEQREKAREERKHMVIQRLVGIALITFSIVLSIVYSDPELKGCTCLIGLPLGSLLLLAKQRILCL